MVNIPDHPPPAEHSSASPGALVDPFALQPADRLKYTEFFKTADGDHDGFVTGMHNDISVWGFSMVIDKMKKNRNPEGRSKCV